MVPLRFVSEQLGAEVAWDGATFTAVITSQSQPEPTPTPEPSPSPSPDAQPRAHARPRSPFMRTGAR